MGDNLKRHDAIKVGLEQLYGQPVQGHFQHNLNTLALIINGIIGSGSVQLPKLAIKAPLNTKVESRSAKLSRFLKNDHIKEELYWLPFAQKLLTALSKNKRGLTLVIDGSLVGRGCVALLIAVVYAGRALPVAWLVNKGNKGHFCATAHVELLDKVAALVPPKVAVTFLGDGEFDGTLLQERLTTLGWKYVVRTAKNAKLYLKDCDKWTSYQQMKLAKGQTMFWREVGFSAQGYGRGKLLKVGYWEVSFSDPLYLITNLGNGNHALDLYKKRYRIETIFSEATTKVVVLDWKAAI